MSEVLSNNFLISQFISNAELYRSSYLSLLEKLVSSLTTEENKLSILTELGTIDIPSNNYLLKKIVLLENLLTEILNNQSVTGPDGINRKFEPISNILSNISIDSSNINYSASRKFLDLFVSLKLPINIRKSKSANIRMYKLNSNIVPEFIDEFYSVEESNFLRDCAINNVNLELTEFYENSVSKKYEISGSFRILNINNSIYTLDTLYCDEPIRNLLNSRLLKVGDILITENSSSSFKISEINTFDTSVKLELISGVGKVNIIEKLYIKSKSENIINISVLPTEKLILFIRTEDSIENSKSKFINTSDFNILDSVGNQIDKNSLSDLESVFNYFKGVFKEKRISIFSGKIPKTPILNLNNFKIVKTNEHRLVDIDKNKVIGFWNIPETINNQHVIAFKVQYRYLDLHSNSLAIVNERTDINVRDSYTQQIEINNTISTGSYSIWNEVQTSTRNKVIVNNEIVWESSNESDSNIRSFNSIDLPIFNKEKIQIRVKSLSEVGFDNNNPLESEWSNIIELELNEVEILKSQIELTKITNTLFERVSLIENTISNSQNLSLSLVDENNITQQLQLNKENIIELPNFQNFITSNNLFYGNIQNLNYQLKIKNNSLSKIQLRSRDFTFIGDVKSSNFNDSTFDSIDREYNEFLKYDLFGFENIKQTKNQILRLRGTSLFGNSLELTDNSILINPDYSLLSTLNTNPTNEIYTPNGNKSFNDILSLNLSNWFFIHKDSINFNTKINKIFSKNYKNVSILNSTLKNQYELDDLYLVGPLSNGISVKIETDLSKITTDIYGNFYLESDQEIVVKFNIKSRFYDYMSRSYSEELIKLFSFDLFMLDSTRTSFDIKFVQK